MELKLENYFQHNYHNEKVVKWMVENHVPDTKQEAWGCDGDNNWGCDCDTYPVQMSERIIYYYVKLNQEEIFYQAYYDKYDFEYLIKEIPDLTEEEIEELEDVENIRIYYCDVCHLWCLDADNI